MSSRTYSSVVPFPPEVAWAWHERPGALRRLAPPWLALGVVEEPTSLADGRAVFALPGGARLAVQHRPESYQAGKRFADDAANLACGLVGWRHERLFSASGPSSALVEDRVWSRAGSETLRQAFAYSHRQLAADLSSHARSARPLSIALTGSSGLIGSELAAFLSSGGHKVLRLVRRPPAGPGERQWAPDEPAPELFSGVDAVVHLAGAPIGRRFTERHKSVVWESRVGPTERLAEAAARAARSGRGPSCFVCASAIGFYGYDRQGEVSEENDQGEGFLARLVAAWEAATAPAAAAGIRVVNVRTGIVQTPRGGALGLLYPAFLAGLGGRVGSGRQHMSWIGIDDLLDVYLLALLDARLAGPVNAVSPFPVTASEYARVLGAVLRRPAFFALPARAAGWVLGDEGAREFALASQKVVPSVLQRLGHSFRYPELPAALRHVLGRWE